MEFEYSERTKKLKAEIEAFMDEYVFPNEATYYAQLDEGDTRWKPVPILDELKAKAKSAGLWNLFLPESERGAYSRLESPSGARLECGRNRFHSPAARAFGFNSSTILVGIQGLPFLRFSRISAWKRCSFG